MFNILTNLQNGKTEIQIVYHNDEIPNITLSDVGRWGTCNCAPSNMGKSIYIGLQVKASLNTITGYLKPTVVETMAPGDTIAHML